MTQILLRGNRRFGMLCAVAGMIGLLLGSWLVLANQNFIPRIAGGLSLLISTPTLWVCWQFFFKPRMAMTNDELLVYIRSSGKPLRVPLDVGEVFFMGQGAVRGTEPGHPKKHEGTIAANVIVRLAESATDWQRRDVQLLLGVWRDGYITIRGLWCEDIQQDLLKLMNRELLQAKRHRRKARNE
jgi:hypothetical protein